MTEDQTRASDALSDRAQVRIFTLADYVAVEPSGRLYISGAGLEWLGLPAFADQLSSFDLVIRLAFPMSIARSSHSIDIRALDADGQPVGPDPLIQTEMRFDLQRAPSDATEMSGNLPLRIVDYPLSRKPDDAIFLHLLVDGVLISRLPVEVRPMSQ